jgi:hypothetical protein
MHGRKCYKNPDNKSNQVHTIDIGTINRKFHSIKVTTNICHERMRNNEIITLVRILPER